MVAARVAMTDLCSAVPFFDPPCAQVSDGRVKSVSAASAGDLISDGWTLLDVRPPHEVEKVPPHLLLGHQTQLAIAATRAILTLR